MMARSRDGYGPHALDFGMRWNWVLILKKLASLYLQQFDGLQDSLWWKRTKFSHPTGK
jgi:hypothetical protein